MLVFHIAGRSDWNAAQRTGVYFSPGFDDRGRLDAHLSCVGEDEWEDVRRRVYADALEPLVLLEIDTERLTSRVEAVGTAYRVLGPVDTGAVVGVRALPRASAKEISASLARATAKDFGGEMLLWGQLVAAFALCVLGLAAAGRLLAADPGMVIGAGLGLLLTVCMAVGSLQGRGAD